MAIGKHGKRGFLPAHFKIRDSACAGLSHRGYYPIGSSVLLFNRILNFKKEAVAASDKRQAQRFAVGHPFPFKAVLTLNAHDEEGDPLPGHSGQDWAGRLVNLSASGGSIHLHAAASAHRGESCTFKLSLDDYLLEFTGTVAHFRNYPQFTSCGFSFDFPDFEMKKAYLQLLEPVSIGASLAPVEAEKKAQELPGLHKDLYVGTANSSLTTWRQISDNSIYSFDFRMNDYGARWSEGMTEIETYGVKPGGEANAPAVRLKESELEEVRWLFCLAVPNLAKAVPLDVRKFLGTLVA